MTEAEDCGKGYQNAYLYLIYIYIYIYREREREREGERGETCPHGYHHNSFVETHALGQMMYG